MRTSFEIERGFFALSFGIGKLPDKDHYFRIQICFIFWLFTFDINKK